MYKDVKLCVKGCNVGLFERNMYVFFFFFSPLFYCVLDVPVTKYDILVCMCVCRSSKYVRLDFLRLRNTNKNDKDDDDVVNERAQVARHFERHRTTKL